MYIVCVCDECIIQEERKCIIQIRKLGCVWVCGVLYMIVSFIMFVGVRGLESVMGESVMLKQSGAKY